MQSALVVGAGVFGLSVARSLAGRGWQVEVVDHHEPGTHGPSAAASRIIRFSHGPDQWSTRMAWQARWAWRALEAETGCTVLLPCGVVLLAAGNTPGSASSPPPADRARWDWEEQSVRVVAAQGIRVERLSPRLLCTRFSGLGMDGIQFGVYEPEAGVLLARKATLALAASALERGVTIRPGEAAVRPAAEAAAGQDAALVDGTPYHADVVVWAAGAGLVDLFPGLTSARRIDEASAYLTGQHPGEETGSRGTKANEASRMPVWISRSEDFYAIPPLDERGVKAGPANGTLAAKIALRLPALADVPQELERCHYTQMPDDHFLLARHPVMPSHWLVGGDGGRGFKHGPAWGDYVADVITGHREAPRRFGLR